MDYWTLVLRFTIKKKNYWNQNSKDNLKNLLLKNNIILTYIYNRISFSPRNPLQWNVLFLLHLISARQVRANRYTRIAHKTAQRGEHGRFEYFIGCSTNSRLARINEQEALTESIKPPPLLYIYASSLAVKKKRKKKRRERKKRQENGGMKGGKGREEISGWKTGRVISKKDGGKDGRVWKESWPSSVDKEERWERKKEVQGRTNKVLHEPSLHEIRTRRALFLYH